MDSTGTHATLELHKPENQNADWLTERGTWITYIAIIFGVRVVLWAALGAESHCTAWTWINIIHSVVR
jgi:hypothetical protein